MVGDTGPQFLPASWSESWQTRLESQWGTKPSTFGGPLGGSANATQLAIFVSIRPEGNTFFENVPGRILGGTQGSSCERVDLYAEALRPVVG